MKPVFPFRRSASAPPVVTVTYDTPPPPLPSRALPVRSPTPTSGPSAGLVRAASSAAVPANAPAQPENLSASWTMGTNVLSLSTILNGVGEAVTDAWPVPVWVDAEIAKWRAHGNGHIYLELVERDATGQERAKASARIWSSSSSSLVSRFERLTGERLRDGMRCQWRVKPDFSARYGFGLTIDDVRAVWSAGEHERKKLAIRAKLEAEGVWDAQRQWGMPNVITRIGVVAPFDAAGWGDFSSEAARWEKAGLVTTVMRSATFEGDKASASVSRAIAAFAQEQEHARAHHAQPAYDLLIVLRGGGAKTSLAWMDDEDIARAIATFPGPVWSAIGHEQDRGVPDDVAAWSAHTPSKAAQKIWEALVQETQAAQGAWDELRRALRHRPERIEQDVDHRWSMVYREAWQRCDHAEQTVTQRWDTLRHEARTRVSALSDQVDALIREAVGLGPAATLARGYAVVLDTQGRLVRDPETVAGPWTVRWAHGDRQVMPLNAAAQRSPLAEDRSSLDPAGPTTPTTPTPPT